MIERLAKIAEEEYRLSGDWNSVVLAVLEMCAADVLAGQPEKVLFDPTYLCTIGPED